MGHTEPPSDFDLVAGFDERVVDAPADERVYRVAVQLYDPARVAEIADRASCAPDTARRHLERLAEIGVVTVESTDPITYRRNESYFEWRRRSRLEELSMSELRDRVAELGARDRTFGERYDADGPGDVDALDHATHAEIEDVWLDLDEWATIRRRIERLEAVRRRRGGDSISSGSEVA